MKGTVDRWVPGIMRAFVTRLSGEAGTAEASTILAWIVVGVLVVFALQQGLEEAGNQVIAWVKDQFDQ